jgi:hypothetical protein
MVSLLGILGDKTDFSVEKAQVTQCFVSAIDSTTITNLASKKVVRRCLANNGTLGSSKHPATVQLIS